MYSQTNKMKTTKEIIEVVDFNYVKKVAKKLNVTNISNDEIENITKYVNKEISEVIDSNDPYRLSNREILEEAILYYPTGI